MSRSGKGRSGTPFSGGWRPTTYGLSTRVVRTLTKSGEDVSRNGVVFVPEMVPASRFDRFELTRVETRADRFLFFAIYVDEIYDTAADLTFGHGSAERPIATAV